MTSNIIGAFEAKTHFSQLLERILKGEIITITKHGQPIAVLAPFNKKPSRSSACEAADRLRARAKNKKLGRFNWDEWKAYRDEGKR